MKLKKLFLSLFIISTTFCLPSLPMLALASSSGSINTTGIGEAVNSGVNGQFGSQNAARCGPFSPNSCLKAILGFAQMAMSLMQMLQTMGARDSLSPGTDWSNPYLVDQFGTVQGSESTYINPILQAVGKGDYSSYLTAKDQLSNLSKSDLAKLAAQGYSYDLEKGTITTPSGTKSISSLSGVGLDSNLSALQDRFDKLLGLDTSGGGGMISVDGAAGAKNSDMQGGDSSSFGSRDLSSVDSFLNKLDNGQLDGDKLVGMSKNTKDGDPIGVAMGNIFKTIHVKYKSLSKQNNFK